MKTTTIRTVAAVGRVGAAIVAMIASPAMIRTVAVLGGGAMLSVGASRIYEPAGLIVGGVLLLLAGLIGHIRGGAGE